MNEFDNGNDLLASMLSELNSNADSSPVDATVEPKPPEEIEQLDNFSYDGYQVVRREFFAHIQEKFLIKKLLFFAQWMRLIVRP